MDSSHVFGEECTSSESGWTTYIDSTYFSREDDGEVSDGGNDSDDSMASDATSGPNHHEQPLQQNGFHGFTHFNSKSNEEKYYSYNNNVKKQMEKKKRGEERKTKVEKRAVPVLVANSSTTSSVLSGTKPKVRKFNCLNKKGN
ncbi:hypothetical protein ACHQM5_008762 [Ranunculus cassubicifolius]